MLLFLGKAVAQNDRIVYGKRKLENERHRIGDMGDLLEQEVCAELKQGRCGEGRKQHRHLRIAAGGQKQQGNDYHDGDYADDRHLAYYLHREVVADLRIEIHRVAGQYPLNIVKGV